MQFSQSILKELGEMEVSYSAEEIHLHDLGRDLLEISAGRSRILLSRDAGIDLAFRLADFLSHLENQEKTNRAG